MGNMAGLVLVAIAVVLFGTSFPAFRARRSLRRSSAADVPVGQDPIGVHWDGAAAICALNAAVAGVLLLAIAFVAQTGSARVVPAVGLLVVVLYGWRAGHRLLARHEPFLLVGSRGLLTGSDKRTLDWEDLSGVVFYGADSRKLGLTVHDEVSAHKLVSAALGHSVWCVVPLWSVTGHDCQLLLRHLDLHGVPVRRMVPGAPRRLLSLALRWHHDNGDANG